MLFECNNYIVQKQLLELNKKSIKNYYRTKIVILLIIKAYTIYILY